MRVVIDANVFLSALLSGRGTRPILTAFLEESFQLLTSETLLAELTAVLNRPAWQRLIGPTRARELLTTLREAGLMVHPSDLVTVCRDPKDNALLECALAGRADVIVTGDEDLLVLHPFRGVAILRPRDFLTRLA